MDLYEYQARDLFAAHGVPVLPGSVASTPEEAKAAAEQIGNQVVVKAQVKVGGRGKAGGVKLAQTPDEAKEKAEAILGLDIKGHITRRVLVAQASDIASEYYFSFLLDRANRTFLAMASSRAAWRSRSSPSNAPRRSPRSRSTRTPASTRPRRTRSSAGRELPGRDRRPGRRRGNEALGRLRHGGRTLVEVNPLVQSPDGKIIALDGKVTLDENAEFRQPGHEALVDEYAENPLEAKAKAKNLNYVKLDGQVGIIGNGAGLVMSTLDVVAYAGEKHGGVKPANFLDIGGGASAEVMAAGLDVILNDADVKSVFVNVFGGITACDAVANGIVEALKILGDEASKPLVVRLDGNNVVEGRKILADANHPLVTVVDTMDNAADKAAELAAAGA